MRFLFGVDPLTGTTQYVDYDEATDTFRFVQEADPIALLERNQRLYNEASTRRYGDGLEAVASLHPLLEMTLRQQGIWDDPKARARWLNDPDNRKWRVRPGWV
jgi:hypothetical protein